MWKIKYSPCFQRVHNYFGEKDNTISPTNNVDKFVRFRSCTINYREAAPHVFAAVL